MRKAATWAIPAAAVLLCIALVLSGVLFRGRTWEAMTDPDDIDQVYFDAGLEQSLENGNTYGVISRGPGLTLPKGRYRLQWRIAGDGENSLRIATGNNAPIVKDTLTISPEVGFDSFWFEVEEPAAGVEIQVSFDSGSYIRVDDLRLYSFKYTDHAITLCLLCALFVLGWILNCRGFKWTRMAFLLPVLFAVLYASAPMMKDNLTILHDTGFHLPRFYNLAEGLRAGQFPVRLGYFSNNGYGAATPLFYPDLFLIPGAVLLLLGASGQYVMHLYMISLNLLSAMAMTLLALRIFRDRFTAAIAGILYELSLYRLTDILVRCALGEATAMALLPLFLLGIYEVYMGDSRHWPVLALSAAGIFLCHLLSSVLCLCLATLLLPLLFLSPLRGKRLLALSLSGLLALLLSLWFLVPMLEMMREGLGAAAIRKDPAVNALEPAVLLTWGSGDQILEAKDQLLSGMPMEPGVLLLLGCAFLVSLLLQGKRQTGWQLALGMMVLGLAALAMSTTIFPWQSLNSRMHGILSYLQFPWRLLMFACLFLSLSAAFSFRQLGRGDLVTMAVLAVSVLLALPTTSEQARKSPYIAYGETADPGTPYEEYLYPEAELAESVNRFAEASEGIAVTEEERKADTFICRLEADREGSVLLPLFYFKGYRAELNGEEVKLSIGRAGRIQADVPAGAGVLTVHYSQPMRWYLATLVSFLSFAGLCVFVFRKRRSLLPLHSERG